MVVVIGSEGLVTFDRLERPSYEIQKDFGSTPSGQWDVVKTLGEPALSICPLVKITSANKGNIGPRKALVYGIQLMIMLISSGT